jgi:hypothetical protein
MPDSPILRALIAPVVITLIFFTFLRACTSSVRKTRADEIEAMQKADAAVTTPTSTPAGAPAQKARTFGEITYPPGLDAERVEYLVTIHPEFTEPLTTTVYKRASDYDQGGSAMRNAGYMRRDEEGNMVMTREGLVNLTVASETSDQWTFVIAKRVFERVSGLNEIDPQTQNVTVSWHWDASPVGKRLGVRESAWGATAQLVENQGTWTITKWMSSLKSGTY